jgi:ribosomal subunit interface protein
MGIFGLHDDPGPRGFIPALVSNLLLFLNVFESITHPINQTHNIGAKMVTYKLTSRDIPLSESMYAAVEEQIAMLERFVSRVAHCEIVLSRPHMHHRKNRFHHVRLRLKMPTRDIVIDREVEKNSRHLSFKLALHDAFDSLQRRLENEVHKMRSLIRRRRKVSRDTEFSAPNENLEEDFENQA